MRKKSSRQRRKNKRRFTTIVVTIFILLIIQAAIMITDGDLYKINQAVTSRNVHELIDIYGDKEVGVIPTSAFNIYHDYKENEVAANQRYKGQRIGIIGRVSNVGVDNDNNAIVNLKVSFSFNSLVSARGDSLFTEKSAELKKGQKTLMVCRGAGVESDTPKLSDCKLYLLTA